VEIQIVSDVHVEFFRKTPKEDWKDIFKDVVKPSAPILALLGDIGCPGVPDYDQGVLGYRAFLYQMADLFEHVLVLAGNHEFYINPLRMNVLPATVEECKAVIRTVCQESPKKNITFLDKESVIINGVRVVGATLWSKVPSGYTAREVGRSMNDYHLSYMPAEIGGKKSVRKLTVEDTNDMFAADLKFIKDQLKEACSTTDSHGEMQNAIVLTHHAPSDTGTADPAYATSSVKSAFSTPLDFMFDHKSEQGYPALKAWAFGHTHWCVDTKIKDVRLVANQHGYKAAKVKANAKPYDSTFTIVV